jgi:hypothetical protein
MLTGKEDSLSSFFVNKYILKILNACKTTTFEENACGSLRVQGDIGWESSHSCKGLDLDFPSKDSKVWST